MDDIKLEYYVLNYDHNNNKIIQFNIFNNISLYTATIKELKKYINSPKKYKCSAYREEYQNLQGFEALCYEIDNLIRWQEWARYEYEICAGRPFTLELKTIVKEINKYIDENKSIIDFKKALEKELNYTSDLEKWDCYKQCQPNIETITREIIYQYKTQCKKNK